ncbi:hypothetical protein BLS_002898 [Venturia inaequalis]|uniref:Uncharacterized protein n=1 Tax=Venturia inaequalis TaxID=5025 RepID=A0A8H3YZR1_VENIN|nr:hypothetical protein BLS_002898 [Venturia inaequalis]
MIIAGKMTNTAGDLRQRLAAHAKQYDKAYQQSLAVLKNQPKTLESFKKNSKRDAVITFFNALEKLYKTGMTLEGLKKLFQNFLDDKSPSEQAEHHALRSRARLSIKKKDPHMSFLTGTTAMVLDDCSLASGSTYRSAFNLQNLERNNERKMKKQPDLAAPPEVFRRAVELLAAILHQFRAHTTRNVYEDISVKDGKLFFAKPLLTRDGDFLWTAFPFANVATSKDIEAISSTDGCWDSLNQLAPIILFVLKDICVALEVQAIVLKRSSFPRPTQPTFINSRGGKNEQEVDNHHYIIRSTLNNGQVFAIDLTGAQYGWHETIVPWKEYVERIETTMNTCSLDIMRDMSICNDYVDFSGYQPRALYLLHSIEEAEREVVEVIEVRLKRWLRENDMSIVDFLNQVEQMQNLELLRSVVDGIENHLCDFKKQGKNFYAYDRKGFAFLTNG